MNGADGVIAVLRGGDASEREVSLRSGAAVLDALQQADVSVEDWVVADVQEVLVRVQQRRPAMVFNALHGRGGEDGQLQALLDVMEVPYTGSGMLASALAMDKILTKRLWQTFGLPSAPFAVFSALDLEQDELSCTLSFPVMVKPAREGSSIGMCKVDHPSGLRAAVAAALVYDPQVLVEQWIDGDEYTVALLGQEALPMIRLRTPHDFYDFDAKYQAGDTEYLCPCGLPPETERQLKALALKAFQALDARVWGRIDLMVDRQGQPWLLELNTVPGMTDHSLVPMAARAAGMSFADLVLRILALSGQR